MLFRSSNSMLLRAKEENQIIQYVTGRSEGWRGELLTGMRHLVVLTVRKEIASNLGLEAANWVASTAASTPDFTPASLSARTAAACTSTETRRSHTSGGA